jgi:hypothetical protein
MYINYYLLNKKTAKNSYPLPQIRDLINIVGPAKYLIKINLLLGYWQVRIGELLI